MLSGGGNRGEGRDVVRGADLLAAKQLGSGATHVALCNKIGSYFRHWCKVLAAKFLKDAKTIGRKGYKSVSGKDAISRHSERLAKESSDTNNLIQLQGIKINSTETDRASMPLGIFASKSTSKSVSDVGIAMPTYFKNLAASLPSRLAAKRVAFTLAEVLITLGIIGVVAAITLPVFIQKYQEKITVNKVIEVYSLLSNAYTSLLDEYGAPDTWEDKTHLGIANMFAKKLDLGRICQPQSSAGCYTSSIEYKTLTGYVKDNATYLVGGQGQLKDMFVTFYMASYACRGWAQYSWSSVTESSPYWHMCGTIDVDINGSKMPNKWGVDLFSFIFTDSKIIPQGIPPLPYYSLRSSCNPTLADSWDGSTNGNFCAAWIIVNKNMDYLHKQVSW